MSNKTKLHEILAVIGDRESAATTITTETLKTFGKSHLFLGKVGRYTPFDEASSMEAEETTNQELVTTVAEKLEHTFKAIARAMNVTAIRDLTNQSAAARAAIIVDGEALTPELPATTLLSLESRLKGWLAVLTAIPTLAPGRKWELAPDKGPNIYLDATDDVKFRTKKMTHHKILVEPTPHHPAQIHTWTEDEKVGKVVESSWSGMMSPADKSSLIARLQTLISATKQARQRANMADVVEIDVAKPLIDYLLGS